MRTRVKICGITRPGDAQAAVVYGADAVGLVFVAESPRYVTLQQASDIIRTLPAFVSRVGLFVDAQAKQVEAARDRTGVDTLQFHGNETPEYCRGFGLPYIKTLHMRGDIDVAAQAEKYHDAAALLLDSYHPEMAGGSGEVFDWSQVPQNIGKPLILAGGLHSGNVAQAIRQLKPYAVDVSSGVEASKGIKDGAKIAAFIKEVNNSL